LTDSVLRSSSDVIRPPVLEQAVKVASATQAPVVLGDGRGVMTTASTQTSLARRLGFVSDCGPSLHIDPPRDRMRPCSISDRHTRAAQ